MIEAEIHRLRPAAPATAPAQHSEGCAELSVAPTYTVSFEPIFRQEPAPQIVMLRKLYEGEALLVETELWSRSFPSTAEGWRIIRWMQLCPDQWQAWGRMSSIIETDQLMSWLEEQARSDRAARLEHLREQRRKILRQREKEERRRAKQKELHSYLVDDEDNRQFGVDLRRGGDKKGFFVIWFRERWERERFRDWWRCQNHRFGEFVAFLGEHGAPALERRLLQEMLIAEKKVKRAGLSAGGRRPLRFYRGED